MDRDEEDRMGKVEAAKMLFKAARVLGAFGTGRGIVKNDLIEINLLLSFQLLGSDESDKVTDVFADELMHAQTLKTFDLREGKS